MDEEGKDPTKVRRSPSTIYLYDDVSGLVYVEYVSLGSSEV